MAGKPRPKRQSGRSKGKSVKAAAKPTATRSSKSPPKRAPARKPAKRKAAKPAASSSRVATAAWTAQTRKGRATGFDVCPVCGSKRLDVQKADGVGRVAGKLALGAAIPLLVNFRATATCRSCGWRSEAGP